MREDGGAVEYPLFLYLQRPSLYDYRIPFVFAMRNSRYISSSVASQKAKNGERYNDPSSARRSGSQPVPPSTLLLSDAVSAQQLMALYMLVYVRGKRSISLLVAGSWSARYTVSNPGRLNIDAQSQIKESILVSCNGCL